VKDLLKSEIPHGKFWNKAWSLIEGCTPISPGCKNCWLAGMERRLGARVIKGVSGSLTDGTATGHQEHIPSPLAPNGVFNGIVHCREDRFSIPLKRRKPTVYAIWSDLFHELVPDEFIGSAFGVMYEASHHRFIIVTKRPERAVSFMRSYRFPGGPMPPYVAKNVIIMVTMEDQQRVDERIPSAYALSVNGWNVGILCEPLLGPVSLSKWINHKEDEPSPFRWLITGGESGPGARPAHADWFRSLREQSVGLPFLFKQWGEWGLNWYNDPDGKPVVPKEYNEWMDRMGKKAAGRILDGRTWDEVPDL